MAYVSSNPIPIKDPPFNPQRTRTPYRFHPGTKPKFFSSSLTLLKEKPTQKPFTEILVPGKKPIHDRPCIEKSLSLPYVKTKTRDAQQDPSPINNERNLSNQSVLNIQVKGNNSLNNFGVKKVFRKTQPQIKIIVSRFQADKIQTKLSVDFGNYAEILTPVVLINSPKSAKSIHQSNISISNTSPTTSDRKDLANDPFYYANILNNAEFTPFQSILEESAMLYFSNLNRKIFKKSNKIKLRIKTPIQKSPKAKFECLCKPNFVVKPVHPLRIRDLSKVIPHVELVFFEPQPSWYSKNLVIFSSTTLFGTTFKDLESKVQTLSCIQKLSKSFKIVFVCENTLEDLSELDSKFRVLGIELSALYKTCFPNDVKRELGKMLDYSKVYQDFRVVSPEKQVLVVTSHRIAEVPDYSSDFVAAKCGLSLKINLERAPVHCEEYALTPLTILLPNYLLEENVATLNKVIKQVNVVHKIDAVHDSLHFKVLLKYGHALKVVACAVHQILHEEVKLRFKETKKKVKKTELYCKLHKKTATAPEKFLESMYLI